MGLCIFLNQTAFIIGALDLICSSPRYYCHHHDYYSILEGRGAGLGFRFWELEFRGVRLSLGRAAQARSCPDFAHNHQGTSWGLGFRVRV